MVWMDHRHEEEKAAHSSPIPCLGAGKVSRVMAHFKMISESLLLYYDLRCIDFAHIVAFQTVERKSNLFAKMKTKC
ncbi:hypothetical protein TELCIR_19989, partial [Teladorsagia circumcincta]